MVDLGFALHCINHFLVVLRDVVVHTVAKYRKWPCIRMLTSGVHITIVNPLTTQSHFFVMQFANCESDCPAAEGNCSYNMSEITCRRLCVS